MKITIEQKDLLTSTQRLQGTVSEKAVSYIVLSATNDGRLLLSSSDKILSVFCWESCEVVSPGRVFVPSKLFADIVRSLESGVVTLETVGRALHVSSKGGMGNDCMMKLPLLEDVPWREPQPLEASEQAVLATGKLSYLLDQVQFCVTQDCTRNYGTVAYLHRTNERVLRLVGTDGFRLSLSEFLAEVPTGFLTRGVCLSKRSLEELSRMASEGFDQIRVSISSDMTTLLAEVDNYRLYTRLSTVEYPDYQDVLPQGPSVKVRVSRAQIASVIRRALLASDKSQGVHLTFSEGSLLFTAHQTGTSESREEIPIEGYKGAGVRVSMNGKYLNEVFSNTRTEYVQIEIFESKDAPVVIRPVDEPGGMVTAHVIVPISDNA
jgi:DNA polymerase-3 subunit beta